MRRVVVGIIVAAMLWAGPARAAAANPVSIHLSPIADTKVVGSLLTLTAVLRDAQGAGVAGSTIIVRVTAGAHSVEDLDGIGVTPPGVIGTCVTDADGRCARSYRGTHVTTDTVQAFADANGNATLDAGELQVTVSISWVSAGEGTQTVRLDMHGCDGDITAPIDASEWTQIAPAHPVAPEAPATLCASRFSATDALSPGPIRFVIAQGPGYFTDITGLTDLGRTLVADVSGAYSVAYLSSTVTGTTVVTAAAEGAQAAGTKAWTAGRARAITLAVPAAGASGNAVEAVATALDRFANPVPGVAVSFSEIGAGRFIDESSAVTLLTGDDGTARAGIVSNAGETGIQTITALLSSAATDCGLAAGVPFASAPAGVCSAVAAIEWGFGEQTLTVSAAPVAAVWGTPFVVTATLTASGVPVPGRTVTIARQPWAAASSGGFDTLLSGVTDSLGRVTLVDRPSANTRYRATVAGVPAVDAAEAGVAVRPGVIFNVSAERVTRGAPVTLSGRVLPAHPGSRVALQQLTGRGWRTVATAVLDGSSGYRVTVRRGSAISLLYRIAVGSDADHAWNLSRNRRVTWT